MSRELCSSFSGCTPPENSRKVDPKRGGPISKGKGRAIFQGPQSGLLGVEGSSNVT